VNQASLSVDQLLSALQRKGIPLPFEIGTYLVLQAAEQALVLEATEQGMAAPPVVVMADVWLSDNGEVRVEPSRSATSEQEACRALVVLLGDLLVRSAPGVPPMLLELVEHGPSDGEWTLMRLRDDLEAALVPLNRGALRRILARLLREVRREVERMPSAPAPDARKIDRDVDALFGVESSDPGPAEASDPPSEAAPSELDDAPTQLRTRDELPERPRRAPVRSAARAPRRPVLINDEAPSLPPARSRGAASADLEDFDRASASGGGTRIGLVLVLLAAGLAGGYLLLGRERARSALGLESKASGPTTARSDAEQQKPAAPRHGELRVTSSPERAQVLLFVGTGPVVVPDLPAGVAHEFVALADGRAPSRVVVPADAAWQQDGARRRYELALQLDEADARRPSDELGATRLPQPVGRPSASLGDVRVVTSPPGVRVYQLVGFTPDVRVENLPVSQPVELLVYLAGHELTRIAITASDWKAVDGRMVAALDVPLARKNK